MNLKELIEPCDWYWVLVSEEKESPAAQKMHDSRVSILEKQLEYMRRLVHNAEQERIKATDKISSIEQQKTDRVRFGNDFLKFVLWDYYTTRK